MARIQHSKEKQFAEQDVEGVVEDACFAVANIVPRQRAWTFCQHASACVP